MSGNTQIVIRVKAHGLRNVEKNLRNLSKSANASNIALQKLVKTLSRIEPLARKFNRELNKTSSAIAALHPNINKAVNSQKRLNREFNRSTSAASKFGRSLRSVNGKVVKSKSRIMAFATSLRGLGAVFAIVGAARAGRGIITMADNYTLLENKLKVVTSSTKELTEVQEELYAIASRNYTNIESMTTLYSRFALVMDRAAYSNANILEMVDNIAKAARISGASAQEARGAYIQLSQGIGAGELRSEELRSVLEQLPIVAKVIAKSMGIPFGELRKAAAEGLLTTDRLITGILSQTDALDRQLVGVNKGIVQVYTTTYDQLTRVVAALARISGLTNFLITFGEKLTQVFKGMADILNDPGVIAFFVRLQTVPNLIIKLGNFINTLSWKALMFVGGKVMEGIKYLQSSTASEIEKQNAPLNEMIQSWERLNKITREITDRMKELTRVQGENFQRENVLLDERLKNLKLTTKELRIQDLMEKKKLNYDAASVIYTRTQSLDQLEKARTALEGVVEAEKYRKVLTEQAKKALDAGTLSTAQYNSVLGITAKKTSRLGQTIKSTINDLREQNKLLQLNTQERRVQEELNKERDAVKGPLSAGTEATIRSLVLQNIAIGEQKSLLESIKSPWEEYNNGLRTARALLNEGLPIEKYDQILESLQDKLTSGMSPQELENNFGAMETVTKDLQSQLMTTGQMITDVFNTGLDGASNAISDFVKTGTTNFRKFFAELFLQISQMLAKQVLIQGFMSLFGAPLGFGGGAGLAGAVAGGAGNIGNQLSGGGVSGGGGYGGMGYSGVGAVSGFMGAAPALLGAGAGAAAGYLSGRSGRSGQSDKGDGITIKIVNVLDSADSAENLESSASFERVILNVISRKADEVKVITQG